jgi:general secretion pathway protein A
MYSEYFRMGEPPFSLTPDPRYLFMSVRHREGLAHLLYGIRQPGGFVQLTGDIGSGKTTLCRCLVSQLPPDTDIALILNPRLNAIELLASVCDELGISYPEGTTSIKILVDALNRRLLEAHAKGRRTILIIDEAQNLDMDVLEQIRLLTNLETSREKLLQVILIGQPEFLRVLNRSGLRQLAQRITARYHLLALSRRETFAYIRHRLAVAGCRRPLFTAPAMRQIYRFSGGVPRVINIICDRALLGAYSLDKREVSARMVRRANREMRGIVPWYRRLRSAWMTGGAALAVLIVGGAVFFLTARQSVRQDGAGIAAIGRNTLRALIPESMLTQKAPSLESGGGAESNRGAVAENRGRGTVSSPGTGDEGVRDGGHPIVAQPGPLSSAESTAADGMLRKSGDGFAGAAPTSLRLAEVLANPTLRGTGASSFTSLYDHLGINVLLSQADLGCEAAKSQGFECLFRMGNWTKVRYYDLPAILDLNLPSGQRHRVTLVGLTAETATLVIGGREYSFPLQEIDRFWDGSFILLWKLPFPLREIDLGARGEDVIWVRQSLDTLEGKTPIPSGSDLYDESLRQRVLTFQRDRLLPQDGLLGSATMVRLTLALLGQSAPSLSRRVP